MSAIYRIFIYVLDDNIASVVLFQNLGNLKTNTTKIPVLVLQKLSLLDSSFLDCFIRKIATICSISWSSTCYISKSSTRWHILLFIASFVLPYTTQKCRFHKIDMDFEIVASSLKWHNRGILTEYIYSKTLKTPLIKFLIFKMHETLSKWS